ncbi:MAG: uroporphyrinogen-III C-methyltransferase [bacterium]
MPAGKVYLIGAGPGDPELLTLRGAEILKQAEVVVYDALVSPRLLDLCPKSAELIFVGKRRGHQEMPQAEINRLLVAHARKGQCVVRLKGGDPYIFGRGAEEAEALAAEGLEFRVVPGVTAGIGAAAYAGIPITHRDYASAAIFVTGHDDPDSDSCRIDWPWMARFRGTIAIYMGVTRLVRIAQVLLEHGRAGDTPVALVRLGTLPGQQVNTMTLADVAGHQPGTLLIEPPALVVIGEVVAARGPLDWYSRLPLAGRTVVVARAEGDAPATIRQLEELGARVLAAPAILVGPIGDKSQLEKAIEALERFDWLVFTSVNGVKYFFERLFELGHDMRALGRLKIAAIGPATAARLREMGLVADLVPDKYRSEELAEALAARVGGKRVLLARADRGRTLLKDELEAVAAEVVQVPVYTNADAENLPNDVLNEIRNANVDWVMLTSSAMAKRFAFLLPADLSAESRQRIKFASISPVTSAAAREAGLQIATEAMEYTIQGLIDAMIAFEKEHQGNSDN